MGMKEGTVSRIMPECLVYMLERMAVLFSVIKTLEEGAGEGGFMRLVSVFILMISCIEQKALLE